MKMPGRWGAKSASRAARSRLRPACMVQAEALEGRVLLAGHLKEAIATSASPVDSTFGAEGSVTTNFVTEASLIQPDGKILLAGYQPDGTGTQPDGNVGTQFVLERLNADGTLDDGGAADTTPGDSFNGTGMVLGTPGRFSQFFAVVQQGNRILASGTIDNALAIVAFNQDGSIDTTYGSSGFFIAAPLVQPDGVDKVFGLSFQGSKLLITGAHVASDGSSVFVCCRINPDGSLDTTFNPNGTGTAFNQTGFPGSALTNFTATDPTTTSYRGGRSVTNAAGQVYFVGQLGTKVGMLRYAPDGTVDPTFNADPNNPAASGTLEFSNLQSPDYNIGLALQSDGKVLVAAVNNGIMAINRINADGSPDDGSVDDSTPGDSFGPANSGGHVEVVFQSPTETDTANNIVVSADGKIQVTGTSQVAGQDPQTAIAQFNADGTLDTTFNGTGTALIGDTAVATPRRVTIVEGSAHGFQATPPSTGGGIKALVGRAIQVQGRTVTSLSRIFTDGRSLIGGFGPGAGSTKFAFNTTSGTRVTITMKTGSGLVFQAANSDAIDLDLTDPGAVVIKTGLPISIHNVNVTGSLTSLTASHGILTGTLAATGGIGTLKLSAINGVIASKGSIASITAGSATGAKVLSGVDLGSNGQPGGGDDSFTAGSIGNVKVTGAIATSVVAAGANPGTDGIFGTADDVTAGGGTIKLISARSADSAKFEATTFGLVKLPKKTITTGDPRFVVL